MISIHHISIPPATCMYHTQLFNDAGFEFQNLPRTEVF